MHHRGVFPTKQSACTSGYMRFDGAYIYSLLESHVLIMLCIFLPSSLLLIGPYTFCEAGIISFYSIILVPI